MTVVKNRLILIFLITFPAYINAQIIFKGEFVEGYYDPSTTDSLSIFDKIDGNKLISLPPLKEERSWYKIAISKSKKGWFKIEDIMVYPPSQRYPVNRDRTLYKNKWIQTKHLITDVDTYSVPWEKPVGIKFYATPKIDSQPIVVFLSVKGSIIKTKKLWAKVAFNYNNEIIRAWIEPKMQCPYPWTSCPRSDQE